MPQGGESRDALAVDGGPQYPRPMTGRGEGQLWFGNQGDRESAFSEVSPA